MASTCPQCQGEKRIGDRSCRACAGTGVIPDPDKPGRCINYAFCRGYKSNRTSLYCDNCFARQVEKMGVG